MENKKSIFDVAFEFLKEENSISQEKGLSLLKLETEKDPHNPKTWFEYAGGFDFLGREEEALPHYYRAVELGVERLPDDDKPRIYLQLGSTLRNLKKYDESRRVLNEGIINFPKFVALKTFLALTEYSDHNSEDATKILLKSFIEDVNDSSIRDYKRALTHYVEMIDKFPEERCH